MKLINKKTIFFDWKVTGAISISTILILLSYLCFGFYSESYDVIFKSIFDGTLAGGQALKHYFSIEYLGFSSLLVCLHNLFPNVVWHSWLLLLVQYIATVVVMHSILSFAFEQFNNRYAAFFTSSLFFIVFINEQFINFNFTRASLLCMIAGITIIVRNSSGWLNFFVGILLLLIGMLLRLDTSMLVICAFMMFFIFNLRVRRYWIFIGIYLLIFISLQSFLHNRANNSPYLQNRLQIEHTEVNIMQRINVVPLSEMQTKKDSLMYKAVVNYNLISDTSNIKEQFIYDLIPYPSSLDYIFAKFSIKEVLIAFSKVNKHLTFFSAMLCVIGLLLLLVYMQQRTMFYKLILLNFLFYLYLIFIAYWVDMELRIMSPLLVVLVVLNVFIIKPKFKIDRKILALCVVLLLFISLKMAKSQSRDYKIQADHIHTFLNDLNKLSDDNAIAINSTVAHVPIEAFSSLGHFISGDYWYADLPSVSFENIAYSNIQNKCDCDPHDAGELFISLSTMENLLIVASPFYVEFYPEYLLNVHDIMVRFNEVYSPKNGMPGIYSLSARELNNVLN